MIAKRPAWRAISVLVVLAAGVVLVCCTGATGVQSPTQVVDPVFERFAKAMITVGDLPRGWGHRRVDIVETSIGIARSVAYYGEGLSKPWINVSQTIYIYPDNEASAEAYESAVGEVIPAAYAEKWVKPKELEFQNHADQIVIGCLSAKLSGTPLKSCNVVARYGDMVMMLSGNIFEDRWITMSQFRTLLEKADTRMESARNP